MKVVVEVMDKVRNHGETTYHFTTIKEQIMDDLKSLYA